MNIFTEKTYFETTYSELDKLVSETYGRPWNFLRVEYDVSNDTYLTYEISEEAPDIWLDGEPNERMRRWLNAEIPNAGDWNATCRYYEKCPPAEIVLWDLCLRGLISPGNYLIEVSW